VGREQDDPHWEAMLAEIFGELKTWRAEHPKATFAEIEAIVDERLNLARARFVEDMAAASAAARIGADGEHPSCPECGQPMHSRGQQERQVTVAGNQAVRLRRAYAVCPACGAGLFPPR
jgi:YgiT-type zinc finger domain-containing protein